MKQDQLATTASALVFEGKGILAVDESEATIKRRFDAVGLISTPDTRRDYRKLLCTTEGLEEFISGVILEKETLDQRDDDGRRLVDLLIERGIVPGVKVDCGTTAMPLSPKEKLTQGIYGLRERLEIYREKGARFAKWRAVFAIGADTPSQRCIAANAHALGCFAAFCQEAGIVPVVEPEVLMDGAHSLERCEVVTAQVLERVFAVLTEYGILLEGMLLKPNMVVPGDGCRRYYDVSAVAEATLRCLRRCVPSAVPGIVFLSGGLPPETVTAYLHAMNVNRSLPWTLSFSFGRALHGPALQCWRGRPTRWREAQDVLYQRAEHNAAAVLGYYNPKLDKTA